MSEEIKEILRNCEKAINDASGYNDTTNKILDYMTNLQQKVEQLENIRKEAIEECKSVIGNPEHTIVSKNELMKILLNILNKGDNENG